MLKSSSPDRLEIEPNSKILPEHETFSFDVKVKVSRAFPKRGIEIQKLRDTIYIKNNYFDMKVPVEIIPIENSESLGPVLRTSSPHNIGTRVLKANIKEIGSVNASKKPDLHLKEQLLEDVEECKIRKTVKVEMIQSELDESEDDQINPMELQTLTQIREILKEKHPNLEKLMEISLKQEREKHERQNTKVLQILKVKDDLIDELQRKVIEAENIAHKLNNEKENLMDEISRQKKTKKKSDQKVKMKILDNDSDDESHNDNVVQDNNQDEFISRLMEENRNERSINENLRQQLDESRRKIQEFSKREEDVLALSQQQEEIKRNHLDQLDKTNKQAKELITNLEADKAELTKSLETEIMKSKELEIKFKKLNDENQTLLCENDNVKELFRNSLIELLNTIKLNPEEPSFLKLSNVEDLQKQLRENMNTLKDRVNEYQLKIRDLEAKSKASEEIIINHQAEKNEIITKYNEEIAELRNAVAELESMPQEVTESEALIENLKERILRYEQQEQEREKYVAQLESELKAKTLVIESAKKPVEASESTVTDTNLRIQILALQNQIIEFQKEKCSEPLKIHEDVMQRIETLELTIIELREENAELKADKKVLEESLHAELGVRDFKAKNLETTLNLDDFSNPIESQLKQKCELLQRENIRLKEIESLSNVLPSDKEIIMKTTQKCKIQKDKIKYLKGLLVKAKVEFDNRNVTEANALNAAKVIKLANIIKKLREEFLQKLMEREEYHRKSLSKVFTDNRNKESENLILNERLNKLTEELKSEKLRVGELAGEKSKVEDMLNQHINELETEITDQKVKYKELYENNSKNGLLIQEKLKEVSDLSETLRIIKTGNKDKMNQQYYNANAKLHSAEVINAKLDTKIIDLEAELKKQSESVNELTKEKEILVRDKLILSNEIQKLNAIIAENNNELQKLFKEQEENRIALGTEIMKNDTLNSQLKIERNKLIQFKAQSFNKPLTNAKTDTSIMSGLSQLLKELSSIPENRPIMNKLDAIMDIYSCENEQIIYVNDEIYERYLKLEEENTKLGLLIEAMLTTKEQIYIVEMIKLQQKFTELKKSLHQSDCKIIELSSENSLLKAEIREAQDLVDSKSKELCLTKAKLEKELTLAKINAEEEITSYFDNQVSKILLNDEASCSLGKELCAQKLLNEDLMMKLDNMNKLKVILEKHISELVLALQKESEKLIELHAGEYMKYKKKAELYKEFINDKHKSIGKMGWSKKALKMSNDLKCIEIANLNAIIEQLKMDNEKFKLRIDNQNICECHYGLRKDIIEELTKKYREARAAYDERNFAIEKLQKRMIEMISNHLSEIKEIKEKEEMTKENERIRALRSYDAYAGKYELNETQKQHFLLLRKIIEELTTELKKSKQKLKATDDSKTKFKNEAEEYKKVIMNMRSNTEGRSPRVTQSPFRTKQKLKLCNSVGRKKSAEKMKQSTYSVMYERSMMKTQKIDEEFPTLPKLIQEVLDAKCNEAISEAKVKRLIQDELESKKELRRLQVGLNEAEAKVENYETLLRNNNIEIKSCKNDYVNKLESKITELEAKCEEMHLNELRNMMSDIKKSDTGRVHSDPLDDTTSNLLYNGIITLCNKLAKNENNTEDGLETLQRMIIKSLTDQIANFEGYCVSASIPCDENDKQMWYLQLLDIESQRFEKLIPQINELAGKIDSHQVEEELKLILNILQVLKKCTQDCSYPDNLISDKTRNVNMGSGSSSNVLATELLDVKDINRNLKKQVKDLLENKERLEKVLENIENDSKQNVSELLAHEKLFDQVKMQSKVMTDENIELKAKCEDLMKRVDFLENEEIKALQKENNELTTKLHKGIEERKSEMEYWIKERAKMKETIDGLKADHSLSCDDPENEIDNEAKLKKYRDKVKEMKLELEDKSIELFKVKTDLQDLKSKLHIAELNSQNEQRKIISLSSELRTAKSKSYDTSADTIIKKDDKLVDVSNTAKEKSAQNEFEDRDKMIAVIQQLDHELKQKADEFSIETDKYKENIKSKCEIINSKEDELRKLDEKCYGLQNELNKTQEELCKIRSIFMSTRENSNEARKGMKDMILAQEQEIAKLKQDLNDREEDHKKYVVGLQEEYNGVKNSSREVVSMYELQLKLLKEKFKVEYIELNNKLTIHNQAKGSTSPLKRKEREQSVEFMYQISQKDAQIKLLEMNVSRAKTNLDTMKEKLVKLQNQAKEESMLRPKSRKKKRPELNENNGLIMNSNIDIKEYNEIMQSKTNFELKYEKTKNSLKVMQCQLNIEKDKTETALRNVSKNEQEIERLHNLLKDSKKDQNEIIKGHKIELQKVLNELSQVKSSWKSPEEFSQYQEIQKNMEMQIKDLKEDLSRKKELMRQLKNKTDLRQSEAGKMLTEVEFIKDGNEKLKRAIKEIERKDQTIRSLKNGMEVAKTSERQLDEENKALVEKLKILKAEVGRKDTTLKMFKEKSVEIKSESERSKLDNSGIVEKLTAKIDYIKQDSDRKDDQIRSLTAKLNSLMKGGNKIQTIKNEMRDSNRTQKEDKETEQRLCKAEGRNQNMGVMIRSIFRELMTDIEKLRMKVSAHRIAKETSEELGSKPSSISKSEEYTNADLTELMETVNKIVNSKEEHEDYEKLIKNYKSLIKEKMELERTLNELEGTSNFRSLGSKS